jgi:hypothetical protein
MLDRVKIHSRQIQGDAAKIEADDDLTLHYRSGHLYDKEPATLKERFQLALWQPRDLNEIGISALSVATGQTTLKLNIDATDLAMAQAGDRWTGKLDIFLIERDDAGQYAKVTGQTLGLQLQPATYQTLLRDGLPFDQPLPSHPDSGSMRVVVVDENSGRMGTVTIPATALSGR